MITSIHLKNFRNMQDFSLDLNKFNCLIGENGAGKTTVLQAFGFIKSLAQGNTSSWVKSMGWKPNELNYRHIGMNISPHMQEEMDDTGWVRSIGSDSPISFRVMLRVDRDGKEPLNFEWSGNYLWDIFQCVDEKVSLNGKPLLSYDEKSGDLEIKLLGYSEKEINELETNHKGFFKLPIFFMEYEGSFLSLISSKNISRNSLLNSSYIMDLKNSLLSIDPHVSINSSLMNENETNPFAVDKAKEELLPKLFYSLTEEQKTQVRKWIQNFYPRVEDISTRTPKGGKKVSVRLFIHETRGFIYEHKHADDGLLRLLTIFTRLVSKNDGLFLFDEIENGVNPFIIEKLINLFLNSKSQIIITTHSPLLLNWIPDKIAKQSTFLIYRDKSGSTKSVKYFDLPEPSEELEYMGPGEVFSYLSTKGLDQQSLSELNQ